MKCLICNEPSRYYFQKDFESPYYEHLGTVQYYKCPNCGFVFSKTHVLMDQSLWERVNHLFHTYMEDPGSEKIVNQPPYLEQAMFVNVLQKNGLVSLKNAIDWAGGYGTLSRILRKYFGIIIPVYEKYMRLHNDNLHDRVGNSVQYIPEDELKDYETVISSAVFEHVTRREHLDTINQCVREDGCLILHTVVCENIPQDPNWFYLVPVHSAFHTNMSMDLLMKQWNYSSSIYCPSAKCWLLIKKNNAKESKMRDAVRAINSEFQFNYLHYKRGFMNYWR
jgi:hypothetical protein